MARPFIYIASLRRTGSTVLAEALTRMPEAFIFREPGLGTGSFALKASDVDLWRERSVDLRYFVKKEAPGCASFVEAFRDVLMPRLLESVTQVGVKEIFHRGWREYHRCFPEMKVLLTGRDPRDVYVSLYHRVTERGGKGWDGPFTPEAVADNLNDEFERQQQMMADADCMKVRYEDFCTDPSLLDEIKAFVDSPIEGVGDVGSFNANNPARVSEYEIHRDQITDRRLNRWQREEDPSLRGAASRMIGLMREYCRFWGYEE